MTAIQQEITQLLLKWSKGDADALERLIPIVYPELRRMARRYMGRENSQHTLQTSALINEAYLKLIDQQAVEWQDRAHFFAAAAQVMRRILIDHARRYRYEKRGAGARRIAIDDVAIIADERASEFVALDAALVALTNLDARKGRIVELRFFGGLTVEETAEVLKLSPITIKREWRTARAWLYREISGENVTVDSKL
ncbi:MAG: RNA polymerase subunit sigma-70 [Acidobacteria bacterium]|nr:MAG: RNA polymerase subunit sigma-70 [Acidobacteriota bacterium]